MAKKPTPPAHDGADARTSSVVSGKTQANSTGMSIQVVPKCALPRTGARLTLYQSGGLQATVVDNHDFYRDVDIGRLVGLARPRDIRRRIISLIEKGEILDHQFIQLDDDEGSSVFYIDRNTAMRLAFRSNTGDAENVVMQMLEAFSGISGKPELPISPEKALAGYQRAIVYIGRKDVPRAAKLAMVPVIEKYARAADLTVPDFSELLGPDQPRLEGV